MQKNVPLRVGRGSRCQAASITRLDRAAPADPSGLTRTSSPPRPSSAAATIPRQPAALAASPGAGTSRSPPSAAIPASVEAWQNFVEGHARPSTRKAAAVACPSPRSFRGDQDGLPPRSICTGISPHPPVARRCSVEHLRRPYADTTTATASRATATALRLGDAGGIAADRDLQSHAGLASPPSTASRRTAPPSPTPRRGPPRMARTPARQRRTPARKKARPWRHGGGTPPSRRSARSAPAPSRRS